MISESEFRRVHREVAQAFGFTDAQMGEIGASAQQSWEARVLRDQQDRATEEMIDAYRDVVREMTDAGVDPDAAMIAVNTYMLCPCGEHALAIRNAVHRAVADGG